MEKTFAGKIPVGEFQVTTPKEFTNQEQAATSAKNLILLVYLKVPTYSRTFAPITNWI